MQIQCSSSQLYTKTVLYMFMFEGTLSTLNILNLTDIIIILNYTLYLVQCIFSYNWTYNTPIYTILQFICNFILFMCIRYIRDGVRDRCWCDIRVGMCNSGSNSFICTNIHTTTITATHNTTYFRFVTGTGTGIVTPI